MSDSSLVPSSSPGGGDARQVPVPYSSMPPYGGGYFGETEDFKEKLSRLIDLIVRRKWAFVLSFALILGASIALSLLSEKRYIADSWVLVELDKGSASVTPIAGARGTDGPQYVASQRNLESELLLLEVSDPLAKRVADRLLEIVRSDDRVRFGIIDSDSPDTLTVDDIDGRLSNFISFKAASDDANVIRISATSPVPREAALIANLYGSEYVRLTQDVNRASLKSTREFLEDQEEKWRGELYEAEEAVTSYAGVRDSKSLTQRGSFLVTQMATFEAQRDQTAINLQMRRASLNSLVRELEDISPRLPERLASIESEQISALRSRIADLEIDRRDILLRYPDATPSSHPNLAQIDQDLATLRSELREITTQYVADVESSGGVAEGGVSYVSNLRRQVAEGQIAVDGLEAQIGALDRRIRSYDAEMNTLPQQSLSVARLERNRLHATQMYESVVGQLQDVLIAEQSEPGYARVIREASIPRTPAEPDVPRNLMFGALLGIMLGAALSVLIDKADNRLFKPEVVEELGHRLVGVIPNMDKLLKDEFAGAGFVDIGDRRVAATVVAATRPSSAITEAYRGIRTLIQFSGGENVVRRLLVTSPNMGEGKSVTAANLAIVMAQAGRRTVLVDCDLRRPMVHNVFGVDRRAGLTDAVLHDVPYVELLTDSGIENLSLLTAGGSTERPSELLGSKGFRSLLEELSDDFDMVVLDSPPVRAATDAVLVSTQADGVVLVARAGSTRSDELDYAVSSLEAVGGSLVGILFNAFDISMAYGYKYRYSDYEKYSGYGKYIYDTPA